MPLVRGRLDQNIPVITLVRTIFLDYWDTDFAHAVVIVGYDEQHLLLNDPALAQAPQRATPVGMSAAWGEFDFLAATITKR